MRLRVLCVSSKKKQAMNKLLFFSLIVLFFNIPVFSQQWTDHLNLTNSLFSGKVGNKLYSGSSNGLFLYNTDDYLVEKVSKVNLLSDVEISAMVADGNRLFVGYRNGNIDILVGNSVVNIPDIKLSNLAGSHSINKMIVDGNRLYCCTGYGISVVNIDRREVVDTYFIGTESDNYSINSMIIHGNWIYACTGDGLFRADKNSNMLSYYLTWQNIGGDEMYYSHVVEFNNSLAAVRGRINSTADIRLLTNDSWTLLASVDGYRSAATAGDGIYVASGNSVIHIGSQNDVTTLFSQYVFSGGTAVAPSINHLSVDGSNGRLIVADGTSGLVYCNSNGEGFKVSPNAPASNKCYLVATTPRGVYSLAGGHTTDWNNLFYPMEFSFLSGGQWSSYVSDDFRREIDIVNIAINPSSPDSVYLSSWGTGIFKVNGSTVERHYNQYNSLLQNVHGLDSYYVRVGSICYDHQSNLIMTNATVTPGIIAKTPSNKWIPLSYQPMNNRHSVSHMICTRDNVLWMVIPREGDGLFILSTNNTIENSADDQYRSTYSVTEDPDSRNKGKLLIWDENREEITKRIFAICEDKNGQIWLGTDKGVIVYYRPSAIFTTEYPVATRIKVPRNDGTNNADYLLGDKKVTAICVDAANRKWIGTEDSGVYLVSSDGLTTIHSFNVSNSPLLSNNITSIAVDSRSGEVFIGTDRGLVSYTGNATEAVEKMTSLKIYPNPVKPGYSGDIIIDGFSFDSEVVITDMSGNLVHKGISRGGRLTWNGVNLRGNKVSTGVYIVLAADSEGKETVMGKILFMK